MKNFLKELRWRGMIHNESGLMPGTEEYIDSNKVSGYIGFDPTSDSLHIGNLATIMLLVHFQRAGHTPIALVGGATGMVGDPSGRDSERQLLNEEAIRYNQECIRKQLAHFLDFEAKDNPARMVNNYDWFGQIGFLEFLREAGKYVTINYMMAKDSVKKRIDSDQGISYTEFAYQLLQGYDFLHLYRTKGVRVQMGGADQWGNITTGTHLIGKILGHEAKAFAITCPLITREDGTKFGKTAEGESVWLDAEKTSPYQFYQYWVNVSDSDAEKYIKVFTLLEKEEIEMLIKDHRAVPHLRPLQYAIAKDVTSRVHGKEAYESALKVSELLFNRRANKSLLLQLSDNDLSMVAQEIPCFEISKAKIIKGVNIIDLMAEETKIVNSKGEGRRALKGNAISINKDKINKQDEIISQDALLHGKYLMVENGKKNKYILIAK
ncbi:MAG: tyrosine--tRNA ligase [Bacteroidetes bacterium]|nr:tyrosine--tRNA ligase [Bacteroidota bacterium]